MMKNTSIFGHILFGAILMGGATSTHAHPSASVTFKKMFDETVPQKLATQIVASNEAYLNLTELDAIGARMSGSVEAEKALQWAKQKMEMYGFEKITLIPCQVPKWSRGNHEKATALLGSNAQDLKVNALGGSIGTPAAGITAPVIEVKSLNEVGPSARGKIVFYNQAMDPTLDPFSAYSRLVSMRVQGASTAARFGAVGMLLRSLSTLQDDDHPHTGIMFYRSGVNRIPAAAISTHGANVLSGLLKSNSDLKVKLELSAGEVTTVSSYNIAGEITGSTFPDDVFIVGGHLDSWDLGRGNHDDGAGIVQSLEVVRAIKTLNVRPKRTIRAVLFMSEEFGGVGADQYADVVLHGSQRIVGAMESDRGGFAPVGISASIKANGMRKVKSWVPYLSLAKAGTIFSTSGGGTDTEALGAAGIPEFELIPESAHYFDYHHSTLDQLSAVNATDLSTGAAAMAIFSYLAAEENLE